MMPTKNEISQANRLEFPFLKEHDYRALVFDWDGVLVDSGANYYRAYEMVLQHAGVETTPREIYLREGQSTPQVLADILELHGATASRSKIQEMVERRREYDIALGERKFFPGMWQLLERLRRAGYRTGMVTGSSRKSVNRVLTPDLEKSFDVVITADDVVHPKPHPQPFLLAASALGIEGAKCLVIENAPFGIRSAREAGCSVVAICTTLPAQDLSTADWVVQNHDVLQALLTSNRQPANAKLRGQRW